MLFGHPHEKKWRVDPLIFFKKNSVLILLLHVFYLFCWYMDISSQSVGNVFNIQKKLMANMINMEVFIMRIGILFNI